MTEQNVQGTITRMTTALDNANIDTVMGTYERGAAILFEPGSPISDPAAIRESFKAMVAMAPRFEYGEHSVTIANDIALHLMPWSMTGTAPDGTAVEQRGLSIAVLRRQADASWLMVIDDPHGQRLLPRP
jgi:ketosteroid isomerase-like protein